MTRMVRRTIALLALVLLIPLATATTASAAVCSRPWGSLPESWVHMTQSHLVDVRSGQHPCFDRLVLDFDGERTGYRVRYVPQVYMDGSGEPVPLAGGAFIQIIALGPAYDDDGHSTYVFEDAAHLVDVSGYRVFRQVAWAGSFEGQTTIGLGVRARLPFRVFVLDGPGDGSRIVIDVARRW